MVTGISYTSVPSSVTPISPTTFSYDSFGRRTQMTDNSGNQGFSYDDDGDLLSLTRSFTGGPQSQHLTWQYNPDGSVQSLHIPGSGDVSNALTFNNGSFTYSYDNAERLTQINVPFTGGYLTHAWNSNGWLKKTSNLLMENSPATTAYYGYNSRGFLSSLYNYQYDPGSGYQTGTSLFSGMTYDAMGNRLTETADIAAEGTAPDASRRLAFTYDTTNNPASSNRDVLLNESSVLTGSGDSRYNDVYNNPFSYDYAYNVNEFSIGGTPYGTADNADNQDRRFGFDGDGNPTSYQGATFTFDPEDRLTAISSPAFAATYDGDGLRASKTANGVTTYYLYDGSEPVVEEQVSNGAASISAVNLWAADGWRARYDADSNQFFAFSFDPEGNRVQSQNSHNTLWPTYDTASYEAYGHRGADWTSNGVNPAPYQGPAGFGGEWGYYTDTETGLVLLGHRYYDPGTGRFLNRDPSGYNGGVNLYGFAGDNPVNEQDPSGLDPHLVHARDSKGRFTGQTYYMDIPHGIHLNSIVDNFSDMIRTAPNQFSRDLEAGFYFNENNRNGEVWDFKSYPDSKLSESKNFQSSLYHRRSIAGNYLFGMLFAATHRSLDEALSAGYAFRIVGKLSHVKDWKNGGWLHPSDEQQAIQDGYYQALSHGVASKPFVTKGLP